MDETVLAYIKVDKKFLMLFRNKKENDMNEGKYMGVGGHIEKGETKEQALVREIKEETGLDVKTYQYRAKLKFINSDYQEIMYLFLIDQVEGELIECNEGDLSWIDEDKLLDLKMWEGDKYFLDKLLNTEKYFEMTLYYKDDQFVKVEEGIYGN